MITIKTQEAEMLEKLLVQNFQGHDKFRVDFDPHITCIVGPSDAGKSALIRALRWVSTNQPGGDEFVRHGTKGTTVKLAADGHTVTRRRSPGGSVNEYHLDEQSFSAFGRNVPEPIEQFLNIGSVCWQGQHDAPYWFSDTAGEVSRQLNAIVDLGIIDETLARVGRAFHRARTKLETAEESLTEAKAAHDALSWVPAFEAAVTLVEAAEARHAATAHQAATVATLVQQAQRHQATRDNATGAALLGDTAIVAGERAVASRTAANTLRQLLGEASQHQDAARRKVPSTERMEAALIQHKVATVAATTLQNLIRSVRARKEELCQLERDLQAAEKAVPKRCPTCGQAMP